MTNLSYFTVIADYKSVVADTADSGADPDVAPLTASVVFRPLLSAGDAILATQAEPRPTGFVAVPITGFIDTDGCLKLRSSPDAGITNYTYTPVRLLADSPFLELSNPLFYSVTFSNVLFNGSPGVINGFTFQAPDTDSELDLITVMRQPGQTASGINRIAPGAVRLVDGNKAQFSFGGVDIPDPVELPQGNQGITGPTGPAATFVVGTTTTGAVGSTATVSNSGTSGAGIFNFTVPKGDTGTAATIAVGTTTTGAVGSTATVGNTGTSGAAVFNFSIPRGNTGPTGATGPVGVTIKGSVAAYANLPGSAPDNDAYVVVTDGLLYVRTAGAWPADGSGVPWRGPSATSYERFTATVGDGTATSFVLTHNLNTRAVIVSVYNTSTWEEVEADVTLTSVNSVTVAFATAPTAAQYTVTVVGGGGSGDVTLSGTQTLTNKTITAPTISSPIITGAIKDSSGNSVINLATVASAVNYFQVQNAATGSAVSISANGSDADIALIAFGRGSGNVELRNSNGRILVGSTPVSAVNYVTMQGAITGAYPAISVAGSDTNAGLVVAAKGTGGINIQNGNGIAATFNCGATGVNYLTFKGAATGGNPSIWAAGSDTDINLGLTSKGAGGVVFSTQNGANTILTLYGAATAVNGISINGAIAGATPSMVPFGSDTDISLNLRSKNAGTVQINGNPAGVKVAVPATATSAGVVGQWAADTNWHYDCVATNVWKRAALATW